MSTPALPTRFSLPFLLATVGWSLSVPLLSAANWPAWRGPHGDGRCDETDLPLHWSQTEGVRWKTPLPERGNSTPIIWADRIFVTQAVEKDGRRLLLCFDRANGSLLWERGPAPQEAELTHQTNPHASASPVTDGERVIAWFGSAGLFCYDFSGKELWRRELGPQRHIWGYGSSPALHRNAVLLNFGPGEPSFLVALDKRTGKELWRMTEPHAHSGESKPGQAKAGWVGSWSTPLVINSGAREELLLSWPEQLLALDPESGRELWRGAGLNPLVYTSPLYDPGRAVTVAMGGYNGMSIAVKTGGAGDVTETRRLWHHPKTKQRIGSGVLHEGHIYIHNDPGIAECFELETGRLVWEERLRGPASNGSSWSSMVRAGDRLYTINQGGDAFVLRASPKFEVLATNSLREATMASIAPAAGEVFIRTHQHLWCIGAQK